jgi:hypothetical protein
VKTGKLNTYFKRHMAVRKADESLVCSEKIGDFYSLTHSWS